MQTASGTAESDVSGVYMNMVTKSGGNRFASDHNFYFMNDSLQGDNVDDDLRDAPRPRRRRDRPAPPATRSTSPTTGARRSAGRSCKDKLWFFGATRRWRLDQFQIGARNADGSQAIDDNRIENYMGKITVAGDGQHPGLVHVQPQPQVPVPSPRLALPVRRGPGDDAAGPAGAELRRAGQPGGRAARRLRRALRPHVGRVPEPLPGRRHRHRDARHGAQHAHQRRRDPVDQPQPPLPGQRHLQLLRAAACSAARTTSRSACSCRGSGWPTTASATATSCSRCATACRSRPRSPTRRSSPITRWRRGARSCRTAGCIGRATINVGVRFDGASGYLPEQASPAGTLRRRARVPADRHLRLLAERRRRASASPTTCSATARPPSRPTTAASTTSSARRSSRPTNPNALATQNVAWTDTNGNLRLDTGELGPMPAFARGLFPTFDQDADRPYSDEINVGVEHQLIQNLAVGVSYHRRQHRNGLGLIDPARPAGGLHARGPHLHRPRDGQVKNITVYKLQPAVRHAAEPRHHQRRRARERLQRRARSTSRRRCRTAGRCWPACRCRSTAASTTAARYTQPRRVRRDFNDPNYLHQPRRRLGLHRPAVGVQRCRAATRCRGRTSRSRRSTTPATATR